MLSREVKSLQTLQVGEIVQLAYNQEDYVIKVSDIGDENAIVPNLASIMSMATYEDVTYLLRTTSVSVTIIEAYRESRLIWSSRITALNNLYTNDRNVYLTAGSGGVYPIIHGDGIIILPDGTNIDASGELGAWVLMKYDHDGTYRNAAVIRGVDSISSKYDMGDNVPIVYGVASGNITVSGLRIITMSGLYNYVLTFTSDLSPGQGLILHDGMLLLIASYSRNIVYTEFIDGVSEITFLGADGTTWSENLGIYRVDELEIYEDFLAVVARSMLNPNTPHIVVQFTYEGDQIFRADIPFNGIVITTTMAYDGARFLLYAVISSPAQYAVEEFDIFNNVVVWVETIAPPVSVDYEDYFLSGSIETVSVARRGDVSIPDTYTELVTFGKRFPHLVGVIKEILLPYQGTGPIMSCPYGYEPCATCTTCFPNCELPDNPSVRCCPITLLSGCRVPFIYIMEIGITTAYSDLVPGQEYFHDPSNNLITTDSLAGPYMGTAITSTMFYMLRIGGV